MTILPLIFNIIFLEDVSPYNGADLNATHVGQTVRLAGWVHRVRDHGGVLFIDLRDHYGQDVVNAIRQGDKMNKVTISEE